MKSFPLPAPVALLSFLASFPLSSSAQVAINTTGATPNASAMLDITSTSRGLLVPRMSTSELNAIASPATGLLVYSTTDHLFHYYNGTGWVPIAAAANSAITSNLALNSHWLSNDGDDEGLEIGDDGQVHFSSTLEAPGVSGSEFSFITVDAGGTVVGTEDVTQMQVQGTPVAYFSATAFTSLTNILAEQKVGIGLIEPNLPAEALHVVGHIRMMDGNQAAGYIAVTDEYGTMTWTDPASILTAGSGSQALSLTGNTLSLTNGGSVDLSGYLDNVTQSLSLTAHTLALSGGGGSIDLSSYLDNTDAQALSLSGNTLSLTNGGSVDLSAYLDNVTQSLSLTTNTLALSGGGGSIDLSGYLDNTDAQALSLSGNTLSLANGGSVDLSSYLDNVTQSLSLSTNTLALSGGGGSIDLSGYLDNTDAQALSLSGNTLSLANGGSVDLSGYLDADNLGNHTATANLQLAGQWLSNDGGNEGLRIDNSGNVGVGISGPSARLHSQTSVTGAGVYAAIVENTANSVVTLSNGLMIKAGSDNPGAAHEFISFNKPNGTQIGRVIQSGAGVAYVTTSDERLKTDIAPAARSLADLLQIGVYDYAFRSTPDRRQTGFLAQQLHAHYPEAVTVGGEDPQTAPWMVDYGKLTPLLVASVQEQQVMIDELRAQNAALAAKAARIDALEADVRRLLAAVAALQAATPAAGQN